MFGSNIEMITESRFWFLKPRELFIFSMQKTEILRIEKFDWLNMCLQDEIKQISHSELTDLEAIGQGGYGTIYRAKHAQFDTVAYKEANATKLGDR